MLLEFKTNYYHLFFFLARGQELETCQDFLNANGLTLLRLSSSFVVVDSVAIRDYFEQNGAFAFGASGILLCQHHIHEASGAPHQHHGCRLRARGVSGGLVQVPLRRHARARRGCWRHRQRPAGGLNQRITGNSRRREIQLEV